MADPMTPQEKLAAQLRAHASDCRKAADLNTDVVLQFDQLAAMAEAMDSAAATLLSEHGGGGEAEPFGWVFQHDETGRMTFCPNDGVNTPEGFAELNPRYTLCGPAYTTPLAPAAPVVDDAMGHIAMLRSLRMMYDDGLMQADDHPGTVAALDAAIAALSGVSAPVGVEDRLYDLEDSWLARARDLDEQGDADGCILLGDCARDIRKLADALTPPAAAQRSDKEQHVNAIRTLWEMGWRWKGGKWVAPAAAPRVEESPDEAGPFVCELCDATHPGNRDAALAGGWAYTWDGFLCPQHAKPTTPAASDDGLPEPDAYTSFGEIRWACDVDARQRAEWTPVWMEATIRRLAASGQGVEWHHPDCEGECLSCLIERKVLQEFGTQGRDWLAKRVAAPTQEKGND